MQFLQTHFSQPVKQMYLFVLCCNNASCIQSTEKLQAINFLPQLGGVGEAVVRLGRGSRQERRHAIKIHQSNVGMRRAQIAGKQSTNHSSRGIYSTSHSPVP